MKRETGPSITRSGRRWPSTFSSRPSCRVVSDHEVRRTLALMRQPTDRPLTITIAHDVCRRTDGFAVLGGTLSLVGSEYVIGLEALECRTGEVLTRRQLKASRKEAVLDGIDTVAADIRRMLGEASDSVRRFDSRVHRTLTTRSLDAFEAYTAGERNVLQQGGWSAVPFLTRSIELDPEFAYAHAALGLVLGTFGEAEASRLHTEKAYQLRDRVSEWERLFITAQYQDRVTGDLDQMLTTCEVWVATYPTIARLAIGSRPRSTNSDSPSEPLRNSTRLVRSVGTIHSTSMPGRSRRCE